MFRKSSTTRRTGLRSSRSRRATSRWRVLFRSPRSTSTRRRTPGTIFTRPTSGRSLSWRTYSRTSGPRARRRFPRSLWRSVKSRRLTSSCRSSRWTPLSRWCHPPSSRVTPSTASSSREIRYSIYISTITTCPTSRRTKMPSFKIITLSISISTSHSLPTGVKIKKNELFLYNICYFYKGLLLSLD